MEIMEKIIVREKITIIKSFRIFLSHYKNYITIYPLQNLQKIKLLLLNIKLFLFITSFYHIYNFTFFFCPFHETDHVWLCACINIVVEFSWEKGLTLKYQISLPSNL